MFNDLYLKTYLKNEIIRYNYKNQELQKYRIPNLEMHSF